MLGGWAGVARRPATCSGTARAAGARRGARAIALEERARARTRKDVMSRHAPGWARARMGICMHLMEGHTPSHAFGRRRATRTPPRTFVSVVPCKRSGTHPSRAPVAFAVPTAYPCLLRVCSLSGDTDGSSSSPPAGDYNILHPFISWSFGARSANATDSPVVLSRE